MRATIFFSLALASIQIWNQSVWDKLLCHWSENRQFVFVFLIKIYSLCQFQLSTNMYFMILYDTYKSQICVTDLKIPILFLLSSWYIHNLLSVSAFCYDVFFDLVWFLDYSIANVKELEIYLVMISMFGKLFMHYVSWNILSSSL